MLPALTSALHIPARGHELTLSRVTAVALLIVFGLPLPAALSRQSASAPQDQDDSAGSVREALAGLVIVAIAGNAVENVVGIRLHCSSSCW